MKKVLALATLAAVSLLAACNQSSPADDHGSIKESTSMNYAEASRIVVENFEHIWPDPVQVDTTMVNRGNGCRTNPETLKSEGPPWTPLYEKTVTNPSPEFVERALAQLDSMTTRGFTLTPNPIPGDDPVNRVYHDGRGFSVAAHRDDYPVGVQFTMTSSSPCVDD
ncbi:hypothetical protein [Nocardia yamanashiensis]|uniref:hypothetical protein n=1 Tax=Nocardia yamanashiensis TaxID=209247 RepID=UPI000829E2EE|nr:hypothetical protein [Nocardia yamanashiensis]